MVYSAAKAAVVHFTRCVAMELGEYGVRVNSVSPGAIATGIFAKALGMADASKADALADQMASNFATMQPIPRSGMPDDIAQCVCWLASDRSTFINGEVAWFVAVYSRRSRRAYVRSSRCWGTTIALFRFATTACLLPSHVEDAQEGHRRLSALWQTL